MVLFNMTASGHIFYIVLYWLHVVLYWLHVEIITVDILGWMKYMVKVNFTSFLFLIWLLEILKLNVSHLFLVDRTTLEFLLAAFFVTVTHVGVNSSTHCVLYSTLFYHSVVGRHLDLFHFFFPVVHSVTQVGKCFSRVLLGPGVCTYLSY